MTDYETLKKIDNSEKNRDKILEWKIHSGDQKKNENFNF